MTEISSRMDSHSRIRVLLTQARRASTGTRDRRATTAIEETQACQVCGRRSVQHHVALLAPCLAVFCKHIRMCKQPFPRPTPPAPARTADNTAMLVHPHGHLVPLRSSPRQWVQQPVHNKPVVVE
jgi:hypothetical protein